MAARTVVLRIYADEKDLRRGLHSADRDVGAFEGKVKKRSNAIGLQLRNSLGPAAAIAMAGKTLQVFKAYESNLNLLQVATGASDHAMRGAAAAARQLGADTKLPGASAADAAMAMTELGKAGFTLQQSMDGARGSLQLAAIAEVSAAQAAKIVGAALNAFELDAKNADKVTNLLAASAMAAQGEITDMAMAMQMSATVAHQLGVPVEDLTTAIALMAKAGILGSDSGTSIKTMLLKLSAPTKEARGQLDALGVTIFDTSGKMRSIPEIIGAFQGALKDLTQEQRAAALSTIFGTDAIRAANVMIGNGLAGWDKMSTAVNRQGAAADLAAAKSKGLAGAWDSMLSAMETAGLILSEHVAPIVSELAHGIGALVNVVAGLPGPFQKALLLGVGFMALRGPARALSASLFGVAGSATLAGTASAGAGLKIALAGGRALVAARAFFSAGVSLRGLAGAAVAVGLTIGPQVARAGASVGRHLGAMVFSGERNIKAMRDSWKRNLSKLGPEFDGAMNQIEKIYSKIGPGRAQFFNNLTKDPEKLREFFAAVKAGTISAEEGIERLGRGLDPIPEQLRRAAAAGELGSSAISGIGTAADDTAKELEEAAKKAQEFADKVVDAIDPIGTAFQDAAKDGKVSVKEIIKNLLAEAKAIEGFDANLRKAALRGVPQEILRKWAEMGPAIAGTVKAVVDSSDKDFGRFLESTRRADRGLEALGDTALAIAGESPVDMKVLFTADTRSVTQKVAEIRRILSGVKTSFFTWWDGMRDRIANFKIPGFAHGSVVRGSAQGILARIGEGGPGNDEVVIPLAPRLAARRAQLLEESGLLDEIRGTSSARGGQGAASRSDAPTVSVHVDARGAVFGQGGVEDLVRLLKDELITVLSDEQRRMTTPVFGYPA